MDELRFEQDLVRALLRDQHPDLADLELRDVNGGWDNQLWRLGPELAVRLPRTERAPALLGREQRWLPELAGRLPLPTPAPVRVGRPSNLFGHTWTVVRWVDGEPADRAPITRVEAADALAGFLRALHHQAPPDAPANPARGIPLAALREQAEDWFQVIAGHPDAGAARDVWEEALAAPAWQGAPRWLHGDLHPANAVVRDGTLAGVIDFGEMCAGDPATDLSAAWVLLPAGTAQRFFDAYGYADDATVARARGWAVLRALPLIKIGRNGRLGLPGGKPTWESAGYATLERVLVTADRAHASPIGSISPVYRNPPTYSQHHAAVTGGMTDSAVPETGITIYGCGRDEEVLFREMAPRFGVMPTVTEAALSESNAELASGNRCVSIGHKTRITNPSLLALSRAGVRYISTRSIGYNHIDVDYADSVGIVVENIAYSPDSVADYTLMLMLMSVRNMKSLIRRTDVHDYRLHDVRGRELRDLTVGVVGTGRIGAAVIDRLRGFGCRTLAHDSRQTAEADYVPLDELLRRSDIVTLHTPLTADTYHLLSRERIERMKQGAYIINTGRGSLLDTEALLAGLETGGIGGAALDVLEGEEGVFYADCSNKAIESKLLLRLQEMPNVVISPHTAYYTDHALSDTVENSIINCLKFESGGQHG